MKKKVLLIVLALVLGGAGYLAVVKMLPPPDYREVACVEDEGRWNKETARCEFADPQKDKCVKAALKHLSEKYPEISEADSSGHLVLSYAERIPKREHQLRKCLTEAGELKNSMLDPQRAEIGKMPRGPEKDRKWKELNDYYLKSLYDIDAECKKRYQDGSEKVWDVGYVEKKGLITRYRIVLSDIHCDPIDYSKEGPGLPGHPIPIGGCSVSLQ